MAPIEMRINQLPDEEDTPEARFARQVDNLAEQCGICKLGQKPIGPKSGCEIRKKLVIDKSEVAWKHKHLFLHSGPGKHCKMFQPKKDAKL